MGQILSSLTAFFRRRIAAPQRPPPQTLKRMHLGPPNGQNPLMIQFFEWNSTSPDPSLSWWQHFERSLPDLEELGVTLVWLPPPNKGMEKSGRGYDAYDLWDLGEFKQKGTVATRWGTKAELLSASAAAAKRSISILIDGVLNHKLGADRTETVAAVPVHERDRTKEIGPVRDIKAWTVYEFAGRGHEPTSQQPSTLRWDAKHFNGVDHDERRKKTEIYRFHGREWSRYVDNELGNYDYLLGTNIDHTNAEVREDLLMWGPWVLNTTNARGFRLDAIKHFDHTFTRDFMRTCRDTVSPDLFAVGEYWTGKADVLEDRLHRFEGTLALFDVALHENFFKASRQGRGVDLRRLLRGSLVERCPDDAVLFVDNHDTMPGQMLESFVISSFKLIAYATILLRPAGFPCVFSGDLFEDGREYDPHVATLLRQLLLARRHHAYGPILDFFQAKNCIGWFREGDEAHPGGCAVVLALHDRTRPAPACVMALGSQHANQEFRMLFGETMSQDGGQRAVSGNDRGTVRFESSGQVAVWVPVSGAA